MAICINKNLPEYSETVKHFDNTVTESNLKAAIGVWQKYNGMERFPTIGEIKGVLESAGISYKSSYMGEHNEDYSVVPFKLPTDAAHKSLERVIKSWLNKAGITYEVTKEIRDSNGNIVDAVGQADIINKIIRVVEGKSDIKVLAEEAGHIMVEMLQGTPLFDRLMESTAISSTYSEVLIEYEGIYNSDIDFLKEAAGKLIAQELLNMSENPLFTPVEEDISFLDRLRSILKDIMNYFKSIFKDTLNTSDSFKEATSPFIKAAQKIINKDVLDFVPPKNSSIFYALHTNSIDTFNKNKEILTAMPVVKNAGENFYRGTPDGTPVERLSSIMKALYLRIYGDRELTGSEDSNFYADKGITLHKWYQLILHAILNNETITYNSIEAKVLKELSDEGLNTTREDLKGFIRLTTPQFNHIVGAIKAIKKQIDLNTKEINDKYGLNGESVIYTELPIINKDKSLAGTLDLVVLYPNGQVAIYDYKNINFKQTDGIIYKGIPDYKIEDFNIRLTQYKNILYSQGITEFAESRIIPINVDYSYAAFKSGQGFTTIQLYNPNLSSPNDEFLTHIAVASEDSKIESLNRDNGTITLLYKRLTNLRHQAQKQKSSGTQKWSPELNDKINKTHKILQNLLVRQDYSLIYDEVVDLYNLFQDRLKRLSADNETLTADFINEVKETIAAYKSFAPSYLEEMKDSLTEAERRKLYELNTKLSSVELQIDEASRDTLRKVTNIDPYAPGKVKIGLGTLFTALSEFSHPAFQMLNAMVKKAETMTLLKTNDAEKTIKEFDKNLEEWAKSKGMSRREAFYKIYDKNTGYLYRRYSDKFVKDEKEARAAQDAKFFLNYFQIEIRKSSDGKMRYHYKGKAEENFNAAYEQKKIQLKNLYPNQSAVQEKELKAWLKDRDISSNPSNIYNPNNSFMYRNYEVMDEYFSDEYKYMLENKPLLDYYNMYVGFNREFSRITGRDIDSRFVANIRQRTIDMMLNTGLGSLPDFKTRLLGSLESRDANNFTTEKESQGLRDLLGEKLMRVPLYFMDSLQDPVTAKEIEDIRTEVAKKYDPVKEALLFNSTVTAETIKLQKKKALVSKSPDLSRTLLLMAQNVYNYEHYAETEANARLLIVEAKQDKFKAFDSQTDKNILDKLHSKIAAKLGLDDGLVTQLEDFVNYYFYGKHNKDITKTYTVGRKLDKNGNVITPGKEISLYTIIKSFMGFSAKATLGLKPTLIARNAVQVKTNIMFTAMEGLMWNTKHLKEAAKAAYSNRKKYMTAIEFMQPYGYNTVYEKANNLSMNAATKNITNDKFFIGLQATDKNADRIVAVSLMHSHGIDVDGKVKPLRKITSGDKRSLYERFSVDDNGVATLEGMSQDEYIRFRQIIQKMATKVKGTIPAGDVLPIYNTMVGTALMQYRGWLPGLAKARFSSLNYDPILDTPDIGRFVVAWQDITSLSMESVRSFIQLAISSIPIIGYFTGKFTKTNTIKTKRLYEQFLAENPGVDFTLDEFVQLRIGKLRALGTELQTVITLFLLTALAKELIPDDDDEPLSSFLGQTFYRVLHGSYLEASFFVSLDSVDEIFRSPMAAIGFAQNFLGLLSELNDETRDLLMGEDYKGWVPFTWERDYYDTKGFLKPAIKMLPGVNGLTDFVNFWDDFNDKKR